MRIIHCSDLHLDSRMETNLDKEKARERRQELMLTFEKMASYARENKVDIIMIAGDLFDTGNNVQIRMKERVLDLIRHYKDIDFLYLQGNHDYTDFFKNLDHVPENLKLFDTIWKSYAYEDLIISGVELVPENNGIIYNDLILDQTKVNIVMLHGQESLYAGKNDGELINLKELRNKNIDYLALGHIHEYKREKLDERGIYCYSGCLEGRGFDECGEKGFVQLDIVDKKVNSKFISFARRRFFEKYIELEGVVGEAEIEKLIQRETQEITREDLVKIILIGEIEEDSDFEIDYIKKKFEHLFYFIKMYDRTQLKIDYQVYENDISLKGEFVRRMQEKNLDAEDMEKAIFYGLKALAGREIE